MNLEKKALSSTNDFSTNTSVMRGTGTDFAKKEREQDRLIDEDLVFKYAMTRDYKNIQDLNIVQEGITFIDSGNFLLK